MVVKEGEMKGDGDMKYHLGSSYNSQNIITLIQLCCENYDEWIGYFEFR